jgi:hypothetical protein
VKSQNEKSREVSVVIYGVREWEGLEEEEIEDATLVSDGVSYGRRLEVIVVCCLTDRAV